MASGTRLHLRLCRLLVVPRHLLLAARALRELARVLVQDDRHAVEVPVEELVEAGHLDPLRQLEARLRHLPLGRRDVVDPDAERGERRLPVAPEPRLRHLALDELEPLVADRSPDAELVRVEQLELDAERAIEIRRDRLDVRDLDRDALQPGTAHPGRPPLTWGNDETLRGSVRVRL